jgi:hypothetical protein
VHHKFWPWAPRRTAGGKRCGSERHVLVLPAASKWRCRREEPQSVGNIGQRETVAVPDDVVLGQPGSVGQKITHCRLYAGKRIVQPKFRQVTPDWLVPGKSADLDQLGNGGRCEALGQ